MCSLKGIGQQTRIQSNFPWSSYANDCPLNKFKLLLF